MNYKDLLENLLQSIGDEISMIKKMIDTIDNQLEQVTEIADNLKNPDEKR